MRLCLVNPAGYEAKGKDEQLKRSKWTKVKKILTEVDKRRIVGKVIEIGVRSVMKNHMYQFGGETMVQQEGGSIGLGVTSVIARIRMNLWVREYKKLCQENELKMLLFKVYVDDENTVWRMIKKGIRWEGGRMVWKEEKRR